MRSLLSVAAAAAQSFFFVLENFMISKVVSDAFGSA